MEVEFSCLGAVGVLGDSPQPNTVLGGLPHPPTLTHGSSMAQYGQYGPMKLGSTGGICGQSASHTYV